MKALALRQPFRELLRTHTVPVLVGCALLAATACFTGLYFSHLPAYLAAVLHYDARQAVLAQTIGVMAHALAILLVGWIGDRVSPLALLRIGAALILALAYPFYHALEARTLALTSILVAGGACGGLINGSFAVLLTDLFPTRIRFSGVALSFNIAFTIFSGMAPLFATTLIRSTGNAAAPAFMGIACAVLALAASLGGPRFGGHVLRASSTR
jgi:MFS family permease